MKQVALFKSYIPMTETAFYILLSLAEPRHGYGITKHVETITNGRIHLGSGTVYGTLTKMQRDGLIIVYADDKRKKIYDITETGQQVMQEEIARLKELHANAVNFEGEFYD